MENLDITILCKVVDNFGDIGVVYRLARAITDLFYKEGACPTAQSSFSPTPLAGEARNAPSPLKLRIVVDNLNSFSLLEPAIDPSKDYQIVNGWEIFQWDNNDLCSEAFLRFPPHTILECFQCGRPDWMEKILFDIKIPNIADIIMIDYLTAEEYAESFHKLMSLTRSSRVKKVNFMPGFTSKTGGLILDKPFLDSLKKAETQNPDSEKFNAVFFSYPRDWTPAVNALQTFSKKIVGGKLNIKLAKGAGFESFKDAWSKVTGTSSENYFSLEELPFLPQTEWDYLLCRTPLLFIRGEDSLSRAALTGHPYIWHAYPQSEDYQLVKVQALLEVMKPYFSKEAFSVLEPCWQIYNGAPGNLEESLTNFLLNYNELKPGFNAFARSLINNGDLALHVIEFINERKQSSTQSF